MPASFPYFPFKVREYKIEVVCMLGGAEFILLKATQWRRRRQNQLEAIHKATSLESWNGRLGWQASLHLMCQACSRCWAGGDQMHTGDLDKVQPPSTCYVTNEINLEPTVCCADISETVQRLLKNHGSQFCELAHDTPGRGLFPWKTALRVTAVMATGH